MGMEEWAVLELMGHRRLAGKVSEEQIAGGSFLRIDIPESGDCAALTQWYGPSAIFSITAVSEDVARKMAANIGYKPVQAWELRSSVEGLKALPAERWGDDDPEDDEPEDLDPDEAFPLEWGRP